MPTTSELSDHHPREHENAIPHPRVTVTFVAWCRIESLRKGIENCLSQDYSDLEILVCDNSPHSEVYDWLIEEYPQVRAFMTFAPIRLPARGTCWLRLLPESSYFFMTTTVVSRLQMIWPRASIIPCRIRRSPLLR